MGFIYKDESLSDEERFVMEWERLEKDNKELFEICIDFTGANSAPIFFFPDNEERRWRI